MRLLVLLLLLCVVPSARADDEPLARAKFAEANVAYNTGDFARALDLYARAYEAKSLPGFLFNMAQCHRQLGNDDQAAFFYRRFLDLASADQPMRPTARELLTEVETRSRVAKVPPPPAYLPAPAKRAGAAKPGAAPVVVESESPGLLRKWWFWTGVGVVAAGATVGTVYAVSQSGPPGPSLGTINVR